MSQGVEEKSGSPAKPTLVDVTFRSGSLTAISVLVGFSLSFLNRWAALPGEWHGFDLVAVGFIGLGIALEIGALGAMLFAGSLQYATYVRQVTWFLTGLGLVVIGVVIAIGGDVAGFGQHTL